MDTKLIEWHQAKHSGYKEQNLASVESVVMLKKLSEHILKPIQEHFGEMTITYGFTSHSLLSYIQKHSPGDMAPSIDQHAAMELNSRGNRICKRDGAACDFIVEGYEQNMVEIAKFICQHLPFDRLYFYGNDRPLHVSFGPEQSRYALIRTTRSDGLRVNTKSAKGSATPALFDNL